MEYSRDDTILVQLLKTLYDRQNENDDNTGENTLIQYFEAPHDTSKVTAWVQVYVALQALSSAINEQLLTTASVSASSVDPTTLMWGGYDDSGTYHDAGWNWDSGGVWK